MIIKTFESKKNNVSLTDEGIVVKKFKNSLSCDTEEQALLCLDGNHAPKLISRKDNTLFIEYVEGTLLVDEYINIRKTAAEKLAAALARAVKDIYAATGKITFDENFRNYIVKNNEIIRVDFEETTNGTPESWCAKLFAFATLYDAPNASKLAFMLTLANGLGANGEKLCGEYKSELEFLAERWKVPFPTQLFESCVKQLRKP